MKRICLIGNFSGRNIGDEAILRGLIKILKENYRSFKIILPTKFPYYFKNFSPHVLPVKSRIGLFSIATFSELFKSEIFFITQSNLFQQKFLNPFFNKVFAYYLLICLNKFLFKKKIGLVLAGIGPVNSVIPAYLIKKIIQDADFLTFRDKESINYLKKWQIRRKYLIGGDLALLCPRKNTGLTKKIKSKIVNKQVLGINICKYLSEFSNHLIAKEVFFENLKELLEKYKKFFLIFLPTCLDDLKITQEFIYYLHWQNSNFLLIKKCRPEEYIKIQSFCHYFMGMRMHSLILSAVAGTAFLGINYHPKVKDFMDSLGCINYCLDFEEIKDKQLPIKFDKLLKNNFKIKKQIKRKVKELVNRIKKCIEYIKQNN